MYSSIYHALDDSQGKRNYHYESHSEFLHYNAPLHSSIPHLVATGTAPQTQSAVAGYRLRCSN